ncbi:tripartite tricarboxylate transporter substrate binding protein [Raoultella ornithinolytica]|jgi:tripartite-type tricarboxylate transporter receptor subunit TctC|uniref:Tripartite tricarboxylate transporter substrate binding protein n=1 Tax=Raoultella ornithinolytica TaxID=54291 RepID=A0A9Q9JFG3_RAOOR|nr:MULTISPECIES: tripartite tricarboxylate transporter substrate binding protein [Raoultella]AOO59522.1 tricarboxylate transporter family protein [Raoultella ornithinolytica]APB07084.1 tripartite tricarboxylate transporter substrate binding protein [Raoultella ornithinolytica]ASI59669.1 tripartite tricarboxylate transporter substrate binding protein [Raoultella ornithinolytica]AYW55906.1 tripartite tricarboxylate transporter substrate binding protein [Raoultella ornithinolytica]EJD6652548.1 tr
MSKCLLLLIGLCVFSPRILSAQHFPTAPVKIEVGAAAGGGMDIVARALAERLSPLLGQPVLVSNRAGAGGAIAMMALKNAQPDGYTLALVPSWTLSYQPLISTHYRAEDFTLLAVLYRSPDALIARADAPWNSLSQMLDSARNEQKTLLFASQSPVDQLIINWLARQTGNKIAALPTRGGGEMIPKLLGGHVDFAYSATMHTQYVSSGKMKVLASLTDQRQSIAPDVPTLKEQGWDIAINTFFIVVLPAGVPQAITERLSSAFADIMRDEHIRSLIEDKLFMNIDVHLMKDASSLIVGQQSKMRTLFDTLQ